jgi:hypothetical protein
MSEETKLRTTPRDFFLHLGTIVTLYISSVSLLTLLFQIIYYRFPDALAGAYFGYDPYSGAVRMAIASLVIAFPLFWLISWILNRDYISMPEKKALGVRRWLVYFTLFIAGVTIMIDLIVLINTFLGGEVTARFALKVLAVLLIAGLIFGYYIYDFKKYPKGPSKAMKGFLSGAAVLILLSIIAGFFVMGSPSKQREIGFDSQRINDLQMVQNATVNYWQSKNALPQNLSQLNDPISGFSVPVDPETGVSYEYRATGNLGFELCATFGETTNAADKTVPAIYPGANNDNWTHGAGRQCFERTIDPELYPPKNQQGNSSAPAVPTGSAQTNQNPSGPDYFPNGRPGTGVPVQE